MLNDNSLYSFYDLDKDDTLSDSELDRFYGWVFVCQDANGNSSYSALTDDEVIEFANMWISYNTVDNPDYYYYYENGKQITYN